MTSKLSLTAKILLLISIPICFELGFCVFFINQQKEAEAEAIRANQAREIANRVNTLTGEVYEAWHTAYRIPRAELMSSGFFNTAINKFVGKLETQLAILTKLTEDKPDLKPDLAESIATLSEAKKILNELMIKRDQGDLQGALASYKRDSDRLSDLFTSLISHQLDLVAKHEEAFAREAERKQSAIRERAVNAALIALIGNVVFTWIFAIYLVRYVAIRLGAIAANMQAFSRNQPIGPALQGNDEIGQIDRVFRQLVSSVEASNRTKEEFVGMLTHDLRSPLSIIKGFIEFAEIGDFGVLNERGEKLARAAGYNSDKMKLLINNLLDIYKIEDGHLELKVKTVSLIDLFEEVSRQTVDWLKDQQINLVVKETDLRVAADSERLGQVLYNLVSNACKYAPPASTITVAAKKRDNFAEITVSDQGAGIPADKRAVIFQRFAQLESGRGGSGLGLTICDLLVSMHGGKIWVTEADGGGSEFHFTVPLAG